MWRFIARLAALGKGAGVEGVAWQIQFWLCGYGAATMLWVNHRHCLEAIGGTSAEYYGEVRFEIARFLRRLARDRVAVRSNSVGQLRPLVSGSQ